MTDLELLQQFAQSRSQTAFAALVTRHIDLVYSAALRTVRSSQLAEEIAQTVFIDLARQASKLKPDTILAAWLYRVARRTAIDVVRSESRRQRREQIAVELAAMNSPDAHWKDIEPLLDDAMDMLDEPDRAAILLRYFENKSLREVGASLGASDNAAQKRVVRAVEQLREYFSKNGVTIGGAGLATLVSVNAVQASPIGLVASISVATSTALKTIAMTALQKTLIGMVVTVALGTAIFQSLQNSKLRREVQSLHQPEKTWQEQTQLGRGDGENANSRHAQLENEREQTRKTQTLPELLKLRAEVTQLKSKALEQKGDPFQSRH